jgi:pimeloyl-ACP methyl ester carboxylesterase
MRFMYQHQISMATLAGHGVGAKVALATGCYHNEKVTGVAGFDSSPMNQYYHEPVRELRQYLNFLKTFNLSRPFASIAFELKKNIACPKWRQIFETSLTRNATGYEWNFNFDAVYNNTRNDSPSSLFNWNSTYGLYTGRAMFAFPDYSRYVHLGTNTLPMLKVCPQLHGWNDGITSVQGDENPQSKNIYNLDHWIYESEEQTQAAYAFRLRQFLKFYDGVHVLHKSRDEVVGYSVPDIANAREPRDDFPGEYQHAHYHHNWRFNKQYTKA